MITSALTAVGGVVNSDIGAFFGWLTWPALAYLRAVVEANRHEAAVTFARTLGEQVERGLFEGAGGARG